MIKQAIDLWRRPLRPAPTQASRQSVDEVAQDEGSDSRVSLGRDSFGADAMPELPSHVTGNYISLEIEDLLNRIRVLEAKIDELYRRPRMPYTQGHLQSQTLKLVTDGNMEPDWDFQSGLTSDTYTTKDYNDTTGTRTEFWTVKHKNKQPYRNFYYYTVYQPYFYYTPSGGTTPAYTTTPTHTIVSTTYSYATTTVSTTTTSLTSVVDGTITTTNQWHNDGALWEITTTSTNVTWPNGAPGLHNMGVTDAIFTLETLPVDHLSPHWNPPIPI